MTLMMQKLKHSQKGELSKYHQEKADTATVQEDTENI